MNYCSKALTNSKTHDFIMKKVELFNHNTKEMTLENIFICRYCSSSPLINSNPSNNCSNISINVFDTQHIHTWSRYIGQMDNKNHIRCKDSECHYIIRLPVYNTDTTPNININWSNSISCD